MYLARITAHDSNTPAKSFETLAEALEWVGLREAWIGEAGVAPFPIAFRVVLGVCTGRSYNSSPAIEPPASGPWGFGGLLRILPGNVTKQSSIV